MSLILEPVAGSDTRRLRHEVLRSGQPYESTLFAGDDHPMAAHFAVLLETEGPGREIVSVGSIYPDPAPWDEQAPGSWRIRGMATKPELRRRGLGRLVLDALVVHAAGHRANLVWCNARIGAVDFYARAGFVATGDVFDDGVALHQAMFRRLEPDAEAETHPPAVLP